jgi:hypothetical protein
VELIALLLFAVVVFAAAVWLGLKVLAPPLGRMADRMDADDSDEDAG